MYLKAKVITCLIILGLIFGVYGVFITNYSDNEVKRDNDQEVNEISNLKRSQWLVTGIYIDDWDVGNYDWFTINNSYDWCNGAGTWDDPYIIDDVKVDGNGLNNDGIVIINSSVPFILSNCDVYDIGTTGGTGIYLNNVNNSLITNCVAAQCGNAGITMRGSCNNNTIIHTSIYDNQEEGIYIDLLGSGTDILEFSFNNISAHSIYMSGDAGIKVDIDLIGDSKLYFYNNSFIDNHVFESGGDGVYFLAEAEDNSIINFNFTTISENIIHDNDGTGLNFDLVAYDTASIYVNNITIAYNVLAWHDEINGNGILIDGGEEDSGVVEWNDNLIINNTIIDNYYAGIALLECSNFTLRKNSMDGDGIAIASENLASASSHDIDDSNKVNDKPIYYLKGQNGLTPLDYPDPGQLILVNCNDSLIAHTDVSDTVFGISLGWGKNNTIYNNTADITNYAGIALFKSHENNVSTNKIYYSDSIGLYLDRSNDNNVSENEIVGHNGGIYLDKSLRNNITENTISSNSYGIFIESSNYTRVINNTFQCNTNNWYEMNSQNNFFEGNVIKPCGAAGDGDDDDDDDDEGVIPGYDLFIIINTIFILIGGLYLIMIKKRIKH